MRIIGQATRIQRCCSNRNSFPNRHSLRSSWLQNHSHSPTLHRRSSQHRFFQANRQLILLQYHLRNVPKSQKSHSKKAGWDKKTSTFDFQARRLHRNRFSGVKLKMSSTTELCTRPWSLEFRAIKPGKKQIDYRIETAPPKCTNQIWRVFSIEGQFINSIRPPPPKTKRSSQVSIGSNRFDPIGPVNRTLKSGSTLLNTKTLLVRSDTR